MCECFTCLDVTLPHAYIERPEESSRSPGPGVMDGYKLSCESWELNPGPQQEHQELLISESFLHIQVFYF